MKAILTIALMLLAPTVAFADWRLYSNDGKRWFLETSYKTKPECYAAAKVRWEGRATAKGVPVIGVACQEREPQAVLDVAPQGPQQRWAPPPADRTETELWCTNSGRCVERKFTIGQDSNGDPTVKMRQKPAR